MCGRGRFAILAAHEVEQYTHGGGGASRNRNRNRRRHNDNQSYNQAGSADSDGAVNDSLPAESGDHDQDDCKPTEGFPILENLSPGMECPVLVKTEAGYKVETMIWGIIPTYLDPPSANDHYRMFNKRIESLEASQVYPYFKTVLQTKRCVVILDGFYEWKEVAGKKHPYYVSLSNGEPMRMAGIYEDSVVFDPKICALRPAKTFSIITGESCAKFSAMHNRQPVLLTHEQALQWLDCPAEEVFRYIDVLKTAHLDATISMHKAIRYYPVSVKVTNPRYQEPDCTVEKSIGLQMTSFFKSTATSVGSGNNSSGSSSGDTSGVKQEPAIKREQGNKNIHNKSNASGVSTVHNDTGGDGAGAAHSVSGNAGNFADTEGSVLGHKRTLQHSDPPAAVDQSTVLQCKTEPAIQRETVDLTQSPASSAHEPKKAKPSSTSDTSNSTSNSTSKGTTSKSAGTAKASVAPSSPLPAKTKPITSFFSRSPKMN